MLKFTFRFLRSLLVLFGRVFLILGGLVLSSTVQAALSCFEHEDTENSELLESISCVDDLASAQAAYDRGDIDESGLAHYWATEGYRK